MLFSVCSSVDVQRGCFCLLATVNSVAKAQVYKYLRGVLTQISLSTYVIRNGIAWLYGSSISSFVKEFYFVRIFLGVYVLQRRCRGQRTASGSWFSPSTMWALGFIFKLSGWAAGVWISWATSPAKYKMLERDEGCFIYDVCGDRSATTCVIRGQLCGVGSPFPFLSGF